MNLKSIAVSMAVFLVILNSVTVAVQESGVAEDWGVQPSAGGDELINESEQQGESFNVTGGSGSTLFSLFTSAGRLASSVFGFIFAAPQMFGNLGFPDWATTTIFAPLYLSVVALIVYVTAGRLL